MAAPALVEFARAVFAAWAEVARAQTVGRSGFVAWVRRPNVIATTSQPRRKVSRRPVLPRR